jgi:hypothetical protein
MKTLTGILTVQSNVGTAEHTLSVDVITEEAGPDPFTAELTWVGYVSSSSVFPEPFSDTVGEDGYITCRACWAQLRLYDPETFESIPGIILDAMMEVTVTNVGSVARSFTVSSSLPEFTFVDDLGLETFISPKVSPEIAPGATWTFNVVYLPTDAGTTYDSLITITPSVGDPISATFHGEPNYCD